MKSQIPNKITIVTRRAIADQMQLHKLWYHGRLNEPMFLNRIFDLRSMPSSPHERRYDNAYDDIYQHMVNNNDWDSDWIYTDPRINLLHVSDEQYLKFLSETVHPLVRTDGDEVQRLLKIYNENLSTDGFEIVQTDTVSGKAIFSGIEQSTDHAHLAAKKIEIKKYLDKAYVNSKLDIMNDAVNKDTDVAIGTAKELLETVCKSILKQKGIAADPNWTLPRLVKETSNILDFKPKEADDPAKAETSVKQILQGMSSIVQGTAELRNAYGTGHGKDADFKGLEPRYARLLVGAVSEIVIIFLATNGESAELIEPATATTIV